jgi:CHAT domain-containing protein/Tfp pilus assembly protein PilF
MLTRCGWDRLVLVCLVLVCCAWGGRPQQKGEPDVVVVKVAPDSSAAKAGIQVGDHLLTYEARMLYSPDALQAAVENTFGKLTAKIRLRRGADTLTVEAALGKLDLTAYPELTKEARKLYEAGLDFQTAGKPAETAAQWMAAVERAKASGELGSVAWLHEQLADLYAKQSQWKEAQAAYEAGWMLAKVSNDSGAQANLLSGLGQCSRRLNSFDAARQWFSQALLVDGQAGNEFWSARDLLGLGNVALDRGDLASAEDCYRRALTIRERLAPDSLDVAASLNNLGIVARNRGDLVTAEDYYRRALVIKEKLAPDSLNMAITLSGLGTVASVREDLATAEDYYKRALVIQAKMAPDSLDMAGNLNNLGNVSKERDDLASAEDYYRRALVIKEKRVPDSLSVALSLNNLGNVSEERGDLATAEDYHKRALTIRQKLAPDSLDVAASLNNLGSVARDRGDLAAAEDYVKQALVIKEKLAAGSLYVATSLHSLGTTAAVRGDLAAAENYHKRALTIRQKLVPGSLDVAASLYNLGLVARDRGDLATAEDYVKQALVITETLAPNSLDMAYSLSQVGNLALKAHRELDALKYFQDAVTIVESQRRKLSSTETRTLFAEQHNDKFVDLLTAYIRLHDPANAFQTRERQHARSLVEMLADRQIDFSADISKTLLDQQQRLDHDRDTLYRQLGKLDSRKDTKQIDRLHSQLKQLDIPMRDLAAQIRRASPRYAALQYPQPLILKEAQQALDPGTLLLAYSILPEETLLFTLTRKSLHLYHIPISQKRLNDEINLFLDRCSHSNLPYQGQATELYDLLIRRAQAEIKTCQRLLISPDAALYRLPFAALIDHNTHQYLVQSKPLHFVDTLSVYTQLRHKTTDPASISGTILALADPDYSQTSQKKRADLPTVLRQYQQMGGGFEPLPGTRHQAEAIQQFYGDRAVVKLGKEATKRAVFEEGLKALILHFACHGLFDEKLPQESALALAPEGPGDTGLLHTYEVFEKLKIPHATLVVLGACKTGLGKQTQSEGIVGMTRAFEYAGASSVAVTLWKIPEDSTTELMKRFYGHLKGGQSKDVALQLAQWELLSNPKTAHPYHWAAFTLYGDWK